MKKNPSRIKAAGCLTAAFLMAVGAATTVRAADLQAQLVLRPLSAVDVATYGLAANSELSGGLTTVGVGTAVYLEADINIDVPASHITSVTWSLTAKPPGSAAVLTNSPLGTNVPIYEPSDRLVSQVAARRLFRPDFEGQYTVKVTITSSSEGTTNLTQTLTAATYMGIHTCSLCHSGGKIAENKVDPWLNTLHPKIFADQIDGMAGPLRESCLQCHTTGYSANTNVSDGGFSSIAATNGWVIPTVLASGNWAAFQTNYPSLANVANVQCESCHGPGSIHAHSLGDTNFISLNYTSGACNQCHDAASHHPYGTEWLNSGHAITPRESGPGRESCVGCHTGKGFIARANGVAQADRPTDYTAINCQACHEPHGETSPTNNPHMIRALTSVTFNDGTTITNAGEGQLCIQCHMARVNAATYASSYASHFGPHHGPQGDMLEGVNGYTFGETIPSSAHRNAVTNTCVTCHMQSVASSDPSFLKAGAHTFKMAFNDGTNDVDLVGVCQKCHGPAVTDFNFALQDYDGDGVIDGVQTEVQHLMDKLALLLPPVGQSKTTVSPDATWSATQLEAAYNYLFVQEDRSMGIHNTAYAVGLLKLSIAKITGDANNDGLADTWQMQYFGSINSPNAAPNATPAGDGVPNWLKYSLGLNPMIAGVSVPDGVVWANGKSIGGGTNTVHIYTAAEISFDTETNKMYQIQAVSSVGGGWQNIGSPIAGTGSSISYVTPTRGNVQQYYRVAHTQ